jgi:hypothetical protein
MKVKIIFLTGLLVLNSVLLPGCTATEEGALAGHVTIGPLCPLEPCHPSPEQLALAYSSRKVNILTLNRNIVATVPIGPKGDYVVRLAPGNYIVDISHIGIDRSSDVPNKVVIIGGQTTVLNISIDTGLR